MQSTKNDALRSALVEHLKAHPGWRPLSELVGLTCECGHKHTAKEIGGVLGTTPGVRRYLATGGYPYYRWIGGKA